MAGNGHFFSGDEQILSAAPVSGDMLPSSALRQYSANAPDSEDCQSGTRTERLFHQLWANTNYHTRKRQEKHQSQLTIHVRRMVSLRPNLPD